MGSNNKIMPLLRDFLPSPVSIKTKNSLQFPKTCPKPHAESGAQKNPRRELILTGINANNSKLKYGVCSLVSNVLLIFVTNSLICRENTGKMLIFRGFYAIFRPIFPIQLIKFPKNKTGN